ncbi:MAG TPA: hypothetical protein VGJ15_00950 [Pirellulales bacterium]
MKFKIASMFLVLGLAQMQFACGQEYQQRDKGGQQGSPFQEQLPATQNKEELEKKFSESLANVTLQGHYTTGGETGAAPREDKYQIESATKISGDMWLLKVRIQYGGHDVSAPLPLRVVWSGDTPVITLDKMNIPGFGTFTARVMFFQGRYTGMWDGVGHGGILYGTITKNKPADAKDKPTESKDKPAEVKDKPAEPAKEKEASGGK